MANPVQPVIVWAGARVSLDFTGGELGLVFGKAEGQSVFNVTVDGVREMVNVPPGPGLRYRWPHALAGDKHHVEIFKRSEAAKGYVVFAGFELAAGAEASAPAAPEYKMKFEFIGDSITVGACNEDGEKDQWEDYRTHNHALSYATLTSQALEADHRAIAVSGMGVVAGWVDVKAGEVWDRVYPSPTTPRANLGAWQPDVVFINLGENDSSFTTAKKKPFPKNFTAELVELVRAVRAGYPQARIVLLRGGMTNGAANIEYAKAWTDAVRLLEKADRNVSHYVFAHWSQLHPRVADDRAMAEELTAWLKGQRFIKTRLEPDAKNQPEHKPAKKKPAPEK